MLGLALQALTGGLSSGYSAQMQANVARHNARVRANQLEMEAQFAKQKALFARGTIADIKARSAREQLSAEAALRGLRGAQRVAMAASGFEIEDMSPANRRQAEVVKRDIRDNEARATRARLLEAHGYVETARMSRHGSGVALQAGDYRARGAKTAGLLQVATMATQMLSLSGAFDRDVKSEGDVPIGLQYRRYST